MIWATDFREETKTTSQGGGKGGGPKVKTTEHLYYASFAVALCEGPITGIGRIWADGKSDGPRRGDLALVPGRRGAGARSVHRGEDGRGGGAGLPRHRLRGLRGIAARPLRQPPAAALLRGVPPARRSRHRRGADARGHHDPGLGRVRLRDASASARTLAAARPSPRTSTPWPARTDIVVALDRLQAMAPAVESVSLVVAWFGDDLRAGACRLRPGVEVDDKATTPRELVGERRHPRRCLSRQRRRAGPAGLRRHAVRLRGGAGDPGDEGARAARDLLSLHPDGRARRQRPAEPVQRQRRRRPASPPSPGAGASPARRRRASPAPWTRPPPRPPRSRPSSARRRSRTSPSRAGASAGPAPPATGACGG